MFTCEIVYQLMKFDQLIVKKIIKTITNRC